MTVSYHLLLRVLGPLEFPARFEVLELMISFQSHTRHQWDSASSRGSLPFSIAATFARRCPAIEVSSQFASQVMKSLTRPLLNQGLGLSILSRLTACLTLLFVGSLEDGCIAYLSGACHRDVEMGMREDGYTGGNVRGASTGGGG